MQTVEEKGFGERGRNRTFNLLIKSQLLCQLSYAPAFRGRGKDTCKETSMSLTHGSDLANIAAAADCRNRVLPWWSV